MHVQGPVIIDADKTLLEWNLHRYNVNSVMYTAMETRLDVHTTTLYVVQQVGDIPTKFWIYFDEIFLPQSLLWEGTIFFNLCTV
jgi:hypothetical protein